MRVAGYEGRGAHGVLPHGAVCGTPERGPGHLRGSETDAGAAAGGGDSPAQGRRKTLGPNASQIRCGERVFRGVRRALRTAKTAQDPIRRSRRINELEHGFDRANAGVRELVHAFEPKGRRIAGCVRALGPPPLPVVLREGTDLT